MIPDIMNYFLATTNHKAISLTTRLAIDPDLLDVCLDCVLMLDGCV